MKTEPEPKLSHDGSATLQWLLDRLKTNASLHPWEGPFGDAGSLSPEQRVRLARYLADHGEWFVPATLPEGIPGGTPGACFANTTDFVCLHALWRDEDALKPTLPEGASVWDAEYVEGVCHNRKAPVLHAWAAFPGSQRVYDTTYGITGEGDDWEWETPSRFHHYGGTDDMAFVGIRVPREAVLGLISISRLLDAGMPSVLSVPGLIDQLEQEPNTPQMAILRAVGDLLEETTERYAGKRGIGGVRLCLKQVDREIKRREKGA